MKFQLILVALFGVASAQKAAVTNQLCSTSLGLKSVRNVKTSTKTVNINLTAYKKGTDTVTVTSTDTSTSTVSESATITNTAFSTVFVTETPTSTIPTSAGFVPVASDVTYVPKRDMTGRFAVEKRGKFPQQITCGKGKPPSYHPAVYPQSVTCRKVIKTITTKTVTLNYCIRKHIRTTYLPRKTSTRYATITTTTTRVVGQPAETITVSATETATETTTTTSTRTDSTTLTETQTSVAPTATVYAACASNNIIGAANGNRGINAIIVNDQGSNNQVINVGARSAYDCCVACQTTTNCIGAVSSSSCILIIAPTCSPGSTFSTGYQTNPSRDPGSGFIVSNGFCGRIPNAGV
ncbi:uncharacterized protein FIESC28_08149 [Fusarium coffeatum]|uniref:Apple domain-containing protein n=1 Tax=Fusarium coffeatum TaxID=231269 RepID=A0A366R8N4_9HYPO|nr:uncharacterized protein FIESC28_08149 [Fusarium coffeatum]RBR13521.1 hypothetical protein FIESC28_08149 [Fusarium coffeatum]